MKTSAIRHPKRSLYVCVHEWQLVACKNDYLSATLLSILEEKFNFMLNTGSQYRGWMHLSLDELRKNGFFVTTAQVLQSVQLLESISFIKTDVPATYPRKPEYIWIYLDAVQINIWIDQYQKPVEQRAVQFDPMFLLLMYGAMGMTKYAQSKKVEPSMRETAVNVFNFWKFVTKHERAHASDKFLKMICDRLKEGYSRDDLIQAIVGLSHSAHHMGKNDSSTKYDGIKYVFGDSEKVDRFMALAEKMQPSLNYTEVFENFLLGSENLGLNQTFMQNQTTYVNNQTGSSLA